MEQRKNWIVGTGLFLVTMILYWPATSFPFVCYDDQLLVYENPNVNHGLSWAGIKWAITAVAAANWHPLTWWSHMLDCSVYGLFAGGHHLTNILLHSMNAVLLWLLVKRMTGLFWPSALAAALFAWHPLNVESVAWIAERKNVLSTLFFILTVQAYLRYAESPRPARYTLTLILFFMGLASKPMLVTLPFVLLLLDCWPLQRISFSQGRPDLAGKRNWLLLLEKAPFFLLAAADCVLTYVVQNRSGSVKSMADLPLVTRLLNVPTAYMTYLQKTFWPFNLCVFYPLPGRLPVAAGLISIAVLLAVTLLAWHWRFRFRWFLVGWFWFLGTLIPVIGLVQAGYQAQADRYAYLPVIGIFLIVACAGHEWLAIRPQFRGFAIVLASMLLAACLMLARQQLTFWRNSVALFTHTLAVNPGNAIAQDLLGRALDNDGRLTEAIELYSAAVRIHPDNTELQYHLGQELIDAGRFGEAEIHLASALRQAPDNSVLHNTLGVALAQTGKGLEAEKEFLRAIQLQPDYSKPYFNLGKTLLAEDRDREAITNFIAAVQLDPDWPEALQSLAAAYASTGDKSNAIHTASRALKMAQAGHQQELARQIAAELLTYQKTSFPQSSAATSPR